LKKDRRYQGWENRPKW